MGADMAVQATEVKTVEAVAAGSERRYEIDWLRAASVFLVIPLHSAVIFSFGVFNVKHVQHTLAMDSVVNFLSVWIIPLLFVLAGAATKYALERRKLGEYTVERVKRLLVPILMWFVLPIVVANVFGWDFLFNLPGNPQLAFTVIGTGHLWFIIYLFIFSLAALPIFVLLRRPAGQRAISWLANLCEKPGVIFLLAIPVMAISPPDNDSDILKFFYFFYFIYGFILFSDVRFAERSRSRSGSL